MNITHVGTNSGGWRITRDAQGTRIRQGMLDELLRVGMALPPPDTSPDGLIVMLRGAPGTGKSTLALQLAANMEAMPPGGSQAVGQPQTAPVVPRAFFSLEQDADELKAIYCRLIIHQCRAHRALLKARAANTGGGGTAGQLDEVAIKQVLGLLGQPSALPKASGANRDCWNHIQGILDHKADPSQPAQDRAGELVRYINPERIAFNAVLGIQKPGNLPSNAEAQKRDAATGPHLKADPLTRAYDFVESFTAKPTRNERPIIFIDGLSILSEEDRVRLEMGALIESMRSRALIGIIAYEPTIGGEESLDHQVDLVVELEEKRLSTPIDYIEHQLHFKKTRYQEGALGWHQYKIRGYGLEIYPSVHFQVHSHLYMTSQLIDSLTPVEQKKRLGAQVKDPRKRETAPETGWSVVEQVLNGVKPGDSIALLGPRGAFKTALTLDFLFRSYGDQTDNACRPPSKKEETGRRPIDLGKAQHGLLVSVIDNEDTLRVHRACPLVNKCIKACGGFEECCKHAFLFYQRPGAIASPEFIYYLKTRLQVAEIPIHRLAFWDLTQLEHRFPLLANDPMFVPALLDLFKIKMRDLDDKEERRVKSIFMGAANARLSTTIAAVADNVIFCWRDRVRRDPPEKPAPKKEFDDLVQTMTDRVWMETKTKPNKRLDYLMIYVDRTSGGFAQERKNLYAFPILDGSQLYVPAGAWKRDHYAIKPNEIPLYEQSEGQIRHVTEMQGFAYD